MNIKTAQYIQISDLRELSSEANEAIEAFFASDLNISFGSVNRSLLDIPSFIDELVLGLEQQNLWDDTKHHLGYTDILEKLAPLQKTVYIDLEN